MKKVSLVITDLDDTIWDWVGMWYNSFEPYLTNIQKLTGVELTRLKLDFKELHQKYNTSEASFVYKELKTLSRKHKKLISKEIDKPSIIHQYYKDKKENLRLYDGVLETLLELRAKKVRIVGFTESNSFYTKYRIKTLGLDGIFDIVYTPDDHGLPSSVKRYYQDDYWESVFTDYNVLPKKTKKPSPNILLQIVKDMGAEIETTIYIGDKLDRDVYMANQAGVTSVYAKYGHNIDGDAYELLKEVTHWSDEDVKREIQFKQNIKDIKITRTVEINNFKQILDEFRFTESDTKKTDSDAKNIIEIWKNIVGVQKHFNDIEIKLRSFALTLFTFLIAALGFSIKEDANIMIFNQFIPLGTIIGILGIGPIIGFYFMDRHWYHRLLHGAVRQGIAIEKSIRNIYPEINLSDTIKQTSPLKFIFRRFELHSDHKLDIFYALLGGFLLLASISLSFGAMNNVLLEQYRNVRNNSVRLDTKDDFQNAAEKAGIVMTFDNEGTLLSVNETSNIRTFLNDLSNDNRNQSNSYVYCIIKESRKELEEYISKHGVKIK